MQVCYKCSFILQTFLFSSHFCSNFAVHKMFFSFQAASATDCTAIVISTTGNCINGAVLASDAVITECLTSICATMDVWSKAGYANTAKMVVGTGYDATCGPLDKDGDLGDAICAPAGGPTPPPFGPTPPPGPTTKPSGDSGSGDSDGGITGGVVFLIIFFVGGFVYFAAGFAYNFKVFTNTNQNTPIE